jgi:hypothetical protein
LYVLIAHPTHIPQKYWKWSSCHRQYDQVESYLDSHPGKRDSVMEALHVSYYWR